MLRGLSGFIGPVKCSAIESWAQEGFKMNANGIGKESQWSL